MRFSTSTLMSPLSYTPSLYVLKKQIIYFRFLKNIYLFGCVRSQLQHVGCDAQVLEHVHSVVGACRILVPRLGIEPVSLALEGRSLTIGPPEKSLFWLLTL